MSTDKSATPRRNPIWLVLALPLPPLVAVGTVSFAVQLDRWFVWGSFRLPFRWAPLYLIGSGALAFAVIAADLVARWIARGSTRLYWAIVIVESLLSFYAWQQTAIRFLKFK